MINIQLNINASEKDVRDIMIDSLRSQFDCALYLNKREPHRFVKELTLIPVLIKELESNQK